MEDPRRPKVMLDCCDDEPIRNLFSFKTNKIPKKVRETVVSGESDRGVVILGGLEDKSVPEKERDSDAVILKCEVKKAGDTVRKGRLSEGFDDDVEIVEKSDDHGSGLKMDVNDLSNDDVLRCEVKMAGCGAEKDGLKAGANDVENIEKDGIFVSVECVEKSDDHGRGLVMDVNDLPNDEVLRCKVKMPRNIVEKGGLSEGFDDDVENTEKDRSFMSVGSVEKSDDRRSGLAMAVSYRSGQVVNDFLNDNMKIMGKVVDMGGLNKGIDDGVGNNEIDKGSKSVYVTENNDNGNQGSMIKVMEIENLCALESDKVSKPNLDGNLEDSLSIFLPSASIGKPDTNMERKMESQTQSLKDGEHLPAVDVDRSLSSSMVSPKNLESVKISTDSTCSHEITVLHQSPDEHMENTSIAAKIVVKFGSSDDCSLQCRELMPTKEGTHNDNVWFDPSSGDILLNACIPKDDELFGTTTTVSQNQNYFKEGKGILHGIESKENNLSEASKRKSKRRRHDAMAIEDDMDWDGLIQKQGFGQCRLVGEDDPFLKENIGVAVVSEVTRVPALASAEAHASSEEKHNIPLELPKIPSFNEFAKRMKYTKVDDSDARKEGSYGTNTADKLGLREHSAKNPATFRKLFTKVWVESVGDVGIQDGNVIKKWNSQAAEAAGFEIHYEKDVVWDVDTNVDLEPNFDGQSSVSQVGDIKKAVADFSATILMPLYNANICTKERYKYMMKNTVAKVMKHITDSQNAMGAHHFLDVKRKNKIRSYMDQLIENNMGVKS